VDREGFAHAQLLHGQAVMLRGWPAGVADRAVRCSARPGATCGGETVAEAVGFLPRGAAGGFGSPGILAEARSRGPSAAIIRPARRWFKRRPALPWAEGPRRAASRVSGRGSGLAQGPGGALTLGKPAGHHRGNELVDRVLVGEVDRGPGNGQCGETWSRAGTDSHALPSPAGLVMSQNSTRIYPVWFRTRAAGQADSGTRKPRCNSNLGKVRPPPGSFLCHR